MKYTFEDWKKGKINRDYENGLIPELSDAIIPKGLLPESLYGQSRFSDTPTYLDENEYQKIKDAQKEAFKKAIKIAAAYQLNRFKNTALTDKDIDEAKAVIQEEIEQEERKYNNADPNKISAVIRGEMPCYGLDHKKCDYILNILRPTAAIPINLSFIPATEPEAIYSNEWFELTVNREYRKQLKQIKLPEEEKAEIEPTIIPKIIRMAIHKLKLENKSSAKDALEQYARMKIDNPHFTPTDFCKNINNDCTFKVSDNTLKEWFGKYDMAEKMLSDAP